MHPFRSFLRRGCSFTARLILAFWKGTLCPLDVHEHNVRAYPITSYEKFNLTLGFEYWKFIFHQSSQLTSLQGRVVVISARIAMIHNLHLTLPDTWQTPLAYLFVPSQTIPAASTLENLHCFAAQFQLSTLSITPTYAHVCSDAHWSSIFWIRRSSSKSKIVDTAMEVLRTTLISQT